MDEWMNEYLRQWNWSWMGHCPTFCLKMRETTQTSSHYNRRDIWDTKRVRPYPLQEHFRCTDLFDISCWQFGSAKERNLTHLMTSLKTEGTYFKRGTTVLWTWHVLNTVRYSRNKIGKCRLDISGRRKRQLVGLYEHVNKLYYFLKIHISSTIHSTSRSKWFLSVRCFDQNVYAFLFSTLLASFPVVIDLIILIQMMNLPNVVM
jgi:hypothetical protein